MNPFRTLKGITEHPLNKGRKWEAVSRYLKWQVNARLNPHPVIHPFVENSKLIMWKGLTGATGNLYCGLHEFEDMAFLLHFLRPGDLFADVGANVGSYTILASAVAGAETICFEPVPSTWKTLQMNIKVNALEAKVNVVNAAVGSRPGTVRFTHADNNAENHVAAEGDTDTIEVSVKCIDEILRGKVPVLVKMDVEGFETEALKGMRQTLEDTRMKALIIELNGAGSRYGYNDDAIHRMLLDLEFRPCKYRPFSRELESLDQHNTVYNTIYVRDMDFTAGRLRSARRFSVLDKMI